MFQLPDPLTLFGLARLFEDGIIVLATGVSMWSHKASRRADARRLIRTLRRPPQVNRPQRPRSEPPKPKPQVAPTTIEPASRGAPADDET